MDYSGQTGSKDLGRLPFLGISPIQVSGHFPQGYYRSTLVYAFRSLFSLSQESFPCRRRDYVSCGVISFRTQRNLTLHPVLERQSQTGCASHFAPALPYLNPGQVLFCTGRRTDGISTSFADCHRRDISHQLGVLLILASLGGLTLATPALWP